MTTGFVACNCKRNSKIYYYSSSICFSNKRCCSTPAQLSSFTESAVNFKWIFTAAVVGGLLSPPFSLLAFFPDFVVSGRWHTDLLHFLSFLFSFLRCFLAKYFTEGHEATFLFHSSQSFRLFSLLVSCCCCWSKILVSSTAVTSPHFHSPFWPHCARRDNALLVLVRWRGGE